MGDHEDLFQNGSTSSRGSNFSEEARKQTTNLTDGNRAEERKSDDLNYKCIVPLVFVVILQVIVIIGITILYFSVLVCDAPPSATQLGSDHSNGLFDRIDAFAENISSSLQKLTALMSNNMIQKDNSKVAYNNSCLTSDETIITELLHQIMANISTVVEKSVNQNTDRIDAFAENISSSLPKLTALMSNNMIQKDNSKVAYNNSCLTSDETIITELLHQIMANISTVVEKSVNQNTADKFDGIIQTISNLKSIVSKTNGNTNDIFFMLAELYTMVNSSLMFSSHLPISCQDIKKKQPASQSGFYYINGQSVYCEMGEICGSDGGWTRIGYLDMKDLTVGCPAGFKFFSRGNVRACGRPYSSGGSCASITFPSNGISYSKLCGRVEGYPWGSTEGVDASHNPGNTHHNIDSYYVDGVSITQGSPREHIWTLIAGSPSNAHRCPCSNPPGYNQIVQSFVGDNYYCESSSYTSTTLHTNKILWDGNCGNTEPNCCNSPLLPWFSRSFMATTDYIELRVCCDIKTSNENVAVSLYEIYIK